MERAETVAGPLAYEVAGSGEPIVLIHGALIADALKPLLSDPSVTSRYRVIHYHRRGYGGRRGTANHVSVEDHAADCAALLEHLGIERAHILGHSYGGAIALQLATTQPQVAGTLALLEPALMVGESAQGYRDALVRGRDRFQTADPAIVVDEFFKARWPAYREVVDRELPGAFEQAVRDAATWFEREVPGLLEWQFGEAEARRIKQPTLLVLGADSNALWARFGEVHRLLRTWIPETEELIVPHATHFMQLQNPRDLADGLVAFWTSHPLQ